MERIVHRGRSTAARRPPGPVRPPAVRSPSNAPSSPGAVTPREAPWEGPT